MIRQFEVPLRWGDMDAQGHVNNGRFVDYLQEARVDLLLNSPVPELLGEGVLVVGHQVEYLAPVEFSDEPLRVDLSVAEVKGAQFVLAYEMHHAGHLRARARTRLCPYDFEARGPRRLTPAERSFFTEGLVESEPLRTVPRLAVGDRGAAVPLRVRWSDLDPYGHVNNVRFFDYVQEGRIAFSGHLAEGMKRTSGASPAQSVWLVARQDIDFRTQLPFRPEPYEIRIGVASTGRTSLVFCTEIRDPDSGTVFATASSVLVCADITGRPTEVPQAWKDALEPFLLA